MFSFPFFSVFLLCINKNVCACVFVMCVCGVWGRKSLGSAAGGTEPMCMMIMILQLEIIMKATPTQMAHKLLGLIALFTHVACQC